MPQKITDEITEDRRLTYVLLLEQVLGDAALLMGYADAHGWTFEETFMALDARIRELRSQLKG